MTPELTTGPEASLRDVLVARARRSSDARLVVDVAGGIVAVVVAATWQPRVWLGVVTAAACFIAFGAWGITDRELIEHAEGRAHGAVALLRVLRGLAAAIGAVAGIALLLEALGFALGTWIS